MTDHALKATNLLQLSRAAETTDGAAILIAAALGIEDAS